MEQKKYDNVWSEKQNVERNLLDAVEITGREYISVLYEIEEKKRLYFESRFFETFYTTFDAFENEEKQAVLSMHIPMLVLLEEEGVSFYYAAEEQEKSNAGLQRKWSEKIEFDFPENCTQEQKKNIVAKTLEETASEIISKHNYIAEQFGVSYQFYVPDFLGNIETSLEFPMLFVVFQGWPLNASGDITYENCIDAAVFLQKTQESVPMPEGIPYK